MLEVQEAELLEVQGAEAMNCKPAFLPTAHFLDKGTAGRLEPHPIQLRPDTQSRPKTPPARAEIVPATSSSRPPTPAGNLKPFPILKGPRNRRPSGERKQDEQQLQQAHGDLRNLLQHQRMSAVVDGPRLEAN